MNYPESVQYLYALGNELKTAKLGLERVQAVWRRMGLDRTQSPVVHVAGTNGKGSTCAMITAAMRHVGRRVGLYTSPHLVDPTERIQLDGKPVSAELFAASFARVHQVSEAMLDAGEIDAHPSYFETVTLMAFDIFWRQGMEWVVTEVGLGGRLDATNVVDPELCVITPIDFDHEAWLGKGLENIAFEKAGIIKPGVPVVVAEQRPQALQVILRRAEEVGAPVLPAEALDLEAVEMDARGSWLTVGRERLRCPLAGEHQVVNARTAATALRALSVPLRGISEAVWPGRLEFVSQAPEIVLDGAHNPAGAAALAQYIQRFHAGRRVGMVFGAMRDKAFEEVASILFPLADELIVTAPNQPRALRPEAMLELFDHPNARAAATLPEALALPRTADILFITGSLYLVGEARAILCP